MQYMSIDTGFNVVTMNQNNRIILELKEGLGESRTSFSSMGTFQLLIEMQEYQMINTTIESLSFSGGNIGIGTTTPSNKLDVTGNVRITSGSLIATYNSNTVGSIITTGGNVGIGTTNPSYKLEVIGDIYATGNVIAYSDERLKREIEVISQPLDKIERIRGVTYKDMYTNDSYMGVIAQEVEMVCPEVVIEKGLYKGVCYGNMVGLLIEGIKELKEKVKDLENKLENQNN